MYGRETPRAERPHDSNATGTRQMAIDSLDQVDIVVLLTQDAVLATNDSICRLLRVFDDESISAAYGRQIPFPHAKPIEAHARLFNYPRNSAIKAAADIPKTGLKTAFSLVTVKPNCSNISSRTWSGIIRNQRSPTSIFDTSP